MKQLKHARGIRNNIIDSFEKAAVPTVSEAERKRLLSFIVVGGGPTSCEFVSELHGTYIFVLNVNALVYVQYLILPSTTTSLHDRFYST